jgi:uncharacterized protein
MNVARSAAGKHEERVTAEEQQTAPVGDRYWKLPDSNERRSFLEVVEEIRRYMANDDYEYELAIGTDSKLLGSRFQFISVICARRLGKGGIYFYTKSWQPIARFPVTNQKLRMFEEVSQSIQLGIKLQEYIDTPPIIHVDASPPHRKLMFTAQFSEQLRGYVTSCGLECLLKPESYVAHAIADRHTRKTGPRRRRRFPTRRP